MLWTITAILLVLWVLGLAFGRAFERQGRGGRMARGLGWTRSGVRLPRARPEAALRPRRASGALRRSGRRDAGALHGGRRCLAGSARALHLPLRGRVLEQRVQLAAQDEDETADVEPGHQHDHPADRA